MLECGGGKGVRHLQVRRRGAEATWRLPFLQGVRVGIHAAPTVVALRATYSRCRSVIQTVHCQSSPIFSTRPGHSDCNYGSIIRGLSLLQSMNYTLYISGRVYSLLVIKSQILFYLGKDTDDFLVHALCYDQQGAYLLLFAVTASC